MRKSDRPDEERVHQLFKEEVQKWADEVDEGLEIFAQGDPQSEGDRVEQRGNLQNLALRIMKICEAMIGGLQGGEEEVTEEQEAIVGRTRESLEEIRRMLEDFCRLAEEEYGNRGKEAPEIIKEVEARLEKGEEEQAAQELRENWRRLIEASGGGGLEWESWRLELEATKEKVKDREEKLEQAREVEQKAREEREKVLAELLWRKEQCEQAIKEFGRGENEQLARPDVERLRRELETVDRRLTDAEIDRKVRETKLETARLELEKWNPEFERVTQSLEEARQLRAWVLALSESDDAERELSKARGELTDCEVRLFLTEGLHHLAATQKEDAAERELEEALEKRETCEKELKEAEEELRRCCTVAGDPQSAQKALERCKEGVEKARLVALEREWKRLEESEKAEEREREPLKKALGAWAKLRLERAKDEWDGVMQDLEEFNSSGVPARDAVEALKSRVEECEKELKAAKDMCPTEVPLERVLTLEDLEESVTSELELEKCKEELERALRDSDEWRQAPQEASRRLGLAVQEWAVALPKAETAGAGWERVRGVMHRAARLVEAREQALSRAKGRKEACHTAVKACEEALLRACLRSPLDEDEGRKYQENLNQWRQESERWETEESKCAEELAQIRSELQPLVSAQRQLQWAKEVLAGAERKEREAREKVRECKYELEMAKEECEEAEGKCEEAEGKLEEAPKECVEARKEFEEAYEKLEEARKKCQEADKEWEEAERKEWGAKKEWEEARGAWMEAYKKWEEAKKKCEEAKKKCEEAKKKCEEAKKKCEEAEKKCDEAREECQEAKKKLWKAEKKWEEPKQKVRECEEKEREAQEALLKARSALWWAEEKLKEVNQKADRARQKVQESTKEFLQKARECWEEVQERGVSLLERPDFQSLEGSWERVLMESPSPAEAKAWAAACKENRNWKNALKKVVACGVAVRKRVRELEAALHESEETCPKFPLTGRGLEEVSEEAEEAEKRFNDAKEEFKEAKETFKRADNAVKAATEEVERACLALTDAANNLEVAENSLMDAAEEAKKAAEENLENAKQDYQRWSTAVEEARQERERAAKNIKMTREMLQMARQELRDQRATLARKVGGKPVTSAAQNSPWTEEGYQKAREERNKAWDDLKRAEEELAGAETGLAKARVNPGASREEIRTTKREWQRAREKWKEADGNLEKARKEREKINEDLETAEKKFNQARDEWMRAWDNFQATSQGGEYGDAGEDLEWAKEDLEWTREQWHQARTKLVMFYGWQGQPADLPWPERVFEQAWQWADKAKKKLGTAKKKVDAAKRQAEKAEGKLKGAQDRLEEKKEALEEANREVTLCEQSLDAARQRRVTTARAFLQASRRRRALEQLHHLWSRVPNLETLRNENPAVDTAPSSPSDAS